MAINTFLEKLTYYSLIKKGNNSLTIFINKRIRRKLAKNDFQKITIGLNLYFSALIRNGLENNDNNLKWF